MIQISVFTKHPACFKKLLCTQSPLIVFTNKKPYVFMKATSLLFALLIISFSLQSQADNMTLLSQYNPPNMPVHNGLKYNDVWGYVSSSGSEYALVGSADSVVIVKVNSCTDAERVAAYAGGNSVTWRDMKTYGSYAYSVCDGCSEGLKIVDMSDIDNGNISVSTRTTEFTRAHDIYVDVAAGRLYACGTNAGNSIDLVVYDVATNPGNPVLLKEIDFNVVTGGTDNFYIHDLYVINNIAYCSHGNTGLYVWDLTDVNNIPITMTFYDTPGYSHSSWTSSDGAYIYSADENNNPPQPITVLNHVGTDLLFQTTISDPLESSGMPTVHNPYVVGDLLYVSNYEDGLQVWDISNPAAPTSTAHYDTYPDNNGNGYTGYEGNWGVYPFFPSGCIVATDITYGAHFLVMGIVSVPVTWNSFDVKAIKNSSSLLEWSTESEINNEYFEVLRSKDGNNYESIGKVLSKDQGATLQSYDFIDNNPYLGNNYYKIKQVDLDGKFSFSDTKATTFRLDQSTVSVFPNPIKDQLSLTITGHNSSQLQARIHDVSGSLILDKTIKLVGSDQLHSFDFDINATTPSGTYTLSIYEGSTLLWTEQLSVIR